MPFLNAQAGHAMPAEDSATTPAPAAESSGVAPSLLPYLSQHDQTLPSRQESATAYEAELALAGYAGRNTPLCLCILDGEEAGAPAVEIPARAVGHLVEILKAIAEGQDVVVTPVEAALTLAQAADFLDVPRPFLAKLVAKGGIPCRQESQQPRRIALKDVVAYRKDLRQKREAVLDQLVAEAQEHDMGYRG
ncbi:MAG: helix-turn-helix domain-containing protein [Rhodobacteraceae bacterium]|nr:helix-turn-helix domain-containing protein [Paracoccaceae bacterium]